jgi:hypothetical protein
VVGEPQYVEFGPEGYDQDGNLVEKPWAAELRGTWGDLQEHFSALNFTKERQDSYEVFFATFPFGGLKDLPLYHRPPFHLPVFRAAGEEAALDPLQQQALDSIGHDAEGHLRVGFASGKDTLQYPLAVSRPTFGKTFLDGAKRVARQRKHDGE